MEVPFEKAYRLLCSTMPGADIISYEVHGHEDRFGLRTGNRSATVVCYEPRLTTSVRQILGWDFFVDNRFMTTAVRKIAMLWVEHEGGLRYGEPALIRGIRHCFKRFYAESLVAMGPPPLGRTLLIESLIFERDALRDCRSTLQGDMHDPKVQRLRGRTIEFVNQALHIVQYHEMGHIAVKRAGETLEKLSERHLAGIAAAAVRSLLDQGNLSLAEETYCDIFALDSIVYTEDEVAQIMVTGEPSAYTDHHLDQIKVALFCYTMIMDLTQIWFLAHEDTKLKWDPAESVEPRPQMRPSSLYQQSLDRLSLTTLMVERYVSARGGKLYERELSFYINDRFRTVLAAARDNMFAMKEERENAIVSTRDRELAKFLALPMNWSSDTSRYLVHLAGEREWDDWQPVEPEREEAASIDSKDTPDDREEQDQRGPVYTSLTVSNTIKEAYDRYCAVFDNIIHAIVCKEPLPIVELLPKLEELVAEVRIDIELFCDNETYYNDKPLLKFARAVSEHYLNKLLGHHVTTLAMMRRHQNSTCAVEHAMNSQERLHLLEEHTQRHPERGIVAYAAALLPELGANYLAPAVVIG